MKTLFDLTAALAVVLFAGSAAAQSGEEVMAMMDEAMTRAVDQYFEYDIVNEEKGRDPTLMRVRVRIKGPMRTTEFLAPGDMKGTKALVRSRTQMWIYLPAYSKVRRVASSSASGEFMGTTFSNEDISTVTYGEAYTGTLLSQTDEAWIVEATPREGQDGSYGKLEITICKQHVQPLEIRYFNRDGTHLKTETRTGYTCRGEVCNAEVMTMTSHARNDASTQLVRTVWEVNTGIEDDHFSVRNLQN